MSRNRDNGIDLKASRAKKSARQFAHGGNPAHKILPEQAVKNDVPPPAMDDYTMMMIQAKLDIAMTILIFAYRD